jgi:hypothetical protein
MRKEEGHTSPSRLESGNCGSSSEVLLKDQTRTP